MPEEKANLSKQPAPEKKPDAAKLPNAPPKTEKPPDKTDGIKPASAAESRKPEDKTSAVKPPPAEVKKADVSGKDSRKDTVPTSDVKKPEASVKSPPVPAEAKKTDAPANTPGKVSGKDTAPVSSAEKPGMTAKPPEKPAEKVIPENGPKKPEGKNGAAIPPASTEAKKPDAPANAPGKVSDKDTAPVSSAEKPGAAIKPPAKAADEKKPLLNKPVLPPAQKAEPSAKIMLGGKLHDPITPPKAADPPKEPGEQKGVRVTQIFEDRLDYPDEKALNSLPIPKEGEGFSMRLHPAYFYQFLDHPFSVNREVKDYIELYESIRDNGINEPVKARPREKGGLELISGHRRHDIASRLNYPVPVIIAQVDDKKLPFNTAVELAYLKPDEQTKVVDVMKKEQIVPSMAQATALKEASRHADTMQKNLPSLAPAHKVDENKITSIIKPKKAPELKVTFTGAELKDFFPGEMPSVAEVKRVVFDALKIREEAYKRQAKRQAAKDAIKSPEH